MYGCKNKRKAETLRKIPLSFFGKKDLADLTNSIMSDCATLETNNTIMENIRIGRKDATDEEVIAAARLANCEEFAAKLPDGVDADR